MFLEIDELTWKAPSKLSETQFPDLLEGDEIVSLTRQEICECFVNYRVMYTANTILFSFNIHYHTLYTVTKVTSSTNDIHNPPIAALLFPLVTGQMTWWWVTNYSNEWNTF